jgi:hypothetical protein
MALVESLKPGDDARRSVYLRRIGNMLEATFERLDSDDVEIPGVPTAAPVLYIDHDTPWRLGLNGPNRIVVSESRITIGTPDLRRWWLEPRPARPDLGAVQAIEAAPNGRRHAVYLVSSDRAASSASAMTEQQFAYVALGELTHSLRLLAVDHDSDIALLEVSRETSFAPVELTDDIQQGQTWQAFQDGARIVGTIETAWPKVSIRPTPGAPALLPGTPIFVGTQVLGHVGSEPIADGIMHVTSARLVRWWLDKVTHSASPPPNPEQPRRSVREPVVWVQKLSLPSVPRELELQSGASAQKGDHVVVFIPEGSRSRPAGIYRARGGRRFTDPSSRPTSTALDCELVLEIPRPADEVLQQLQPAIAALDSVTSQEDTKRLGIHQRLFDLLGQLVDGAGQVLVAQIFEMETPSVAPKVYIEVPERISTAGLLGVELESEGAVHRFRRHQWGDHEVVILTEPKRPDEPASARAAPIRIQITSVEVDPSRALKEFAVRQFRNRGKDKLWDVVARVASSMSAELIRGPKRDGVPGEYDIQLIVNRAPFVPVAHAYRRGVQFVATVLDAMSMVDNERVVLHAQYAGVGTLDLAEGQARAQAVGGHVTLVWIDPETDIVELELAGHDREEVVRDVGAALGLDLVAVFPPAERNDPLVGRFGIARERRERRLDLSTGRTPTIAVVSGPLGQPIRGYVTFYITRDERSVERIRVQARNGVASCEVASSRKSNVIGAVIEDEGIVLEHLIEPSHREAKP